MPLSETDRLLIERCLTRDPRSWREFINRFLGLVVHVINHTAESRSIRLGAADVEDLVSDVFLAFVDNDYGILRRFRGASSLSAYLTVIARRVVVRQLLKRKVTATLGDDSDSSDHDFSSDHGSPHEARITDQDEVARLLTRLEGSEAEVVRMYHLEGKSYVEISRRVGIPENSVGPTLSRARAKMRRAAAEIR